jgi:hypothetical protein
MSRDRELHRLEAALLRVHELAAGLASLPLTRTPERVQAERRLEAATLRLAEVLADVDDEGGLYPPTQAVPSAQVPPAARQVLGYHGTGGGRRIDYRRQSDPDGWHEQNVRIMEGE